MISGKHCGRIGKDVQSLWEAKSFRRHNRFGMQIRSGAMRPCIEYRSSIQTKGTKKASGIIKAFQQYLKADFKCDKKKRKDNNNMRRHEHK